MLHNKVWRFKKLRGSARDCNFWIQHAWFGGQSVKNMIVQGPDDDTSTPNSQAGYWHFHGGAWEASGFVVAFCFCSCRLRGGEGKGKKERAEE